MDYDCKILLIVIVNVKYCHRNIGCVWKTDSFIPKGSCLSCSYKVSGEVKSFSYLLQRLAVAVQRGNAVSVLGTIALFLRTVTHIN